MSFRIRFSDEAARELLEAVRWYEERVAGLGHELLAAVDLTVVRIAEHPLAGSLPPGMSATDVRRLPVRRFPYHLVYIQIADAIEVIAVAHDRRRPGYWAPRMND